MEIEGKVAVVTGSSSGVGEATAELLAELGAKVIVNYVRGEEAAAEIVKRIRDKGGSAHAVQADVRNDSDCRKLCLLYTSPSPRDGLLSRMPSSA